MSNKLENLYQKLSAQPYTDRMPLLFIGHGSPMNAINNSSFALEWKQLGMHLPTPSAIVCMSAHWLTNGTRVSAAPNPPLIYDFYGFPQDLYTVHYPAVGNALLAHDISTYAPTISPDHERGLDHGVWTVLMHLFPKADIPVIALSIDYEHDRRSQYELIKNVRPLRDKGILFVGSGNIVHNLMRMHNGSAFDWATEFDTKSAKLIAEGNHDALIALEELGEAAALSVPTDDHYRPMINTLALAHNNETPTFFNTEIDLGSVGMRSFVLTN